jgi:hypothetical protein
MEIIRVKIFYRRAVKGVKFTTAAATTTTTNNNNRQHH